MQISAHESMGLEVYGCVCVITCPDRECLCLCVRMLERVPGGVFACLQVNVGFPVWTSVDQHEACLYRRTCPCWTPRSVPMCVCGCRRVDRVEAGWWGSAGWCVCVFTHALTGSGLVEWASRRARESGLQV